MTAVLFQPLAFGEGAAAAVIAKGAVSTLNVTFALAAFPALSAAVPLNARLTPGVLTWIAGGQEAIPEPESEQVNLTVTSVLFQPKLLANGLSVAEIAGGVLSRFTFVPGVAVFPATSVAVPGIL